MDDSDSECSEIERCDLSPELGNALINADASHLDADFALSLDCGTSNCGSESDFNAAHHDNFQNIQNVSSMEEVVSGSITRFIPDGLTIDDEEEMIVCSRKKIAEYCGMSSGEDDAALPGDTIPELEEREFEVSKSDLGSLPTPRSRVLSMGIRLALK